MRALILVDLINDMVSETGKLSQKGYFDFSARHDTRAALNAWRRQPDILTIHVGLEFRHGYPELPKHSRLLGRVADYEVAALGATGSEFVEWAQPLDHEVVIRKRRVSPFFATDLEVVLRSQGIEDVIIGGVATDLAVSSAARDAHDRDFKVGVASDLCVAASDTDNDNALSHLAKFATILANPS